MWPVWFDIERFLIAWPIRLLDMIIVSVGTLMSIPLTQY